MEASLRREIAELKRLRTLEADRAPAQMHTQHPCQECARKAGEIDNLRQELARLHAELTSFQSRFDTLEDEMKTLKFELTRSLSTGATREENLYVLQAALDQTRLDHTTELNEQSTREEARVRTVTFALEGKIRMANARAQELERTIAALRTARPEGKHFSRAPSYASQETQQWDIFGDDAKDYDAGSWTDPTYVHHQPHASPKLFTGTHTQTRTSTATASTTTAQAQPRDDGGRPPRRPNDGGGAYGGGGGGGQAPAPGRRTNDYDPRRDGDKQDGPNGPGGPATTEVTITTNTTTTLDVPAAAPTTRQLLRTTPN